MTEEIRNKIIEELGEEFSSSQLRQIDLAVAKALQGYIITREETLPATTDSSPMEVREFIARKRVKGCSDGTIKQYTSVLRQFCDWAEKDLKQMSDLDILVYLDYFKTTHKVSNRTLDGIRCILSSFYSFLHDSGKIDVSPMQTVDPIKYKTAVREPLTDMEMEEIRHACRNEKENALVEVLYSTGARISEVLSLNRDSIDYLRRRAVVTGKGDKQRFIFFNAKSIYALQMYLDTRTDESEALFVRGKSSGDRLTVAGAQWIIKEIGKRAGLTRPLFPHLFRHTFATDLLSNGAPIEEVSKMLGHEKIETTEIYAKQSAEALASEHKKWIA